MSAPIPAASPQRPGRFLRIVLVLSLAFNLLIVGLAVGAVVKWRANGGPPRAYDISVGPLGRALSNEDRRSLGRALRNDSDARPPTRAEENAALDRLLALLRADPFDAETFADQLAQQRQRSLRGQEVAQALFVSRIAAMPAPERLEFADRLDHHRPRDDNGPPDGGDR